MNFGDKPTTTSGSSMGQYPEWMKKDMLEAQDAYKKLYESNLDRGYRPYTGMTTAGFTPEQIASQQGLASLVGSQAPIQQEALGLTRGVTSEFTPDQAQKYMSPYLRASLDAQKAAAQRQFEGTKLPQFEAQAVAAGGMSGLGSRAGVQAAELQSGQNRLMADLEATGQQKAYEDAQRLFKSQKEREKQSALALQNLNKEMFTGGIKEQALLDAIGGEKQQMAQTMLDEAQTKYYDKEEFARNELNKWYQSLLGNPIWKQPNYEKTGTQGGGGPGMGKTLTSLISTGIGLFSDERMKTDVQKLPKKDKETGLPLYAFRYKGDPKNYPKVVGPMAQEVEKKYPNSVDEVGGRKVIKAAGGGGLSSIDQARRYMNYMRRNMGGQVVPPVVYRQTGGGELLDEDVAFQTGANRPVSDIVAARQAVEAAGMARGVDTLAPDGDGPAVAPPSILAKADIAAPKTALPTRITSPYELSKDFVAGRSKDVANAIVKKATLNRDANIAETKGLRKLTQDFQKTQQDRFNKYQSMVEKLVGDDPNANRKFWFTVAAAIAEPGGNAATNFVKGMHKATLDADADRKEKNKIFMTLAKDEMDFMKDIDKLGFNSEVKILGLTKAMQKELAGLDVDIRKAILDELKITGDLKLAEARLQEAKNKRKGDSIKYARVMNTVSRRFMSEALQAYGYILGEDNKINQIPGNTVLYKENKDKVMNLYLDMFDAYKAAKKDPVKGQTEAAKVLRRHTSSIPKNAINFLIKNPSDANKQQFDKKYGFGSAAKIIAENTGSS